MALAWKFKFESALLNGDVLLSGQNSARWRATARSPGTHPIRLRRKTSLRSVSFAANIPLLFSNILNIVVKADNAGWLRMSSRQGGGRESERERKKRERTEERQNGKYFRNFPSGGEKLETSQLVEFPDSIDGSRRGLKSQPSLDALSLIHI